MDTVIPLRNTVYFIYSVTVFILQSAVYKKDIPVFNPVKRLTIYCI